MKKIINNLEELRILCKFISELTNVKNNKFNNAILENININEINNKDSSEKEINDENYKKINLFEFREIKNTVEYYLNCSLKNITPISDKEVNKASDQSLIEKNNLLPCH